MPEQKVVLLNAGNMASFPVYPYAFIQVPAVARRANIEVVCQDLLGIPAGEWSGTIENLQAAARTGHVADHLAQHRLDGSC